MPEKKTRQRFFMPDNNFSNFWTNLNPILVEFIVEHILSAYVAVLGFWQI